jgi:hypothetical protein
MKYLFVLFLSIIIVYNFNFITVAQEVSNRGWRVGEKQIKILIENPEQINILYELKLNMDFHCPDYNTITAYVTPEELHQIENLNISYSIEIEDLNSFNKDYWLLVESYHSYQDIIDLADSLSMTFPSICKKYIFGYSLQNRQCAALKISDNVDIDEPEAEVLFDGGIHGDEIGGSENIIRFARDLCTKYGTDPTITELINNREIWLYLMVNPDGRVNMSRYNANGVDLNRDWAFMWDAWGGSNGPCSQIESKNLRNCAYSNQFSVHITYHSGTEFISLPWSYRPNQPLDWNHLYQLAGVYSSVSGYSNLEYGQGYNGMYAINGSTKDGNYGIMGSASWTTEISNSKQPPTSQIMLYYNMNYPSMLAMIEYAGYGLEGIVTDAITGDPVTASIFVNDYYPTYTDPSAGDYHKYVLPGTYSITVVANGYQNQTINNIVVSPSSSTTTNFELLPLSGHYVYRFSASQIPDNNYYDEGLTYAVIGPPDNINYSIGKNGWCILDMQYPITDRTGMDFTINEGDLSPEGFSCYAGQSIDGPWLLLGTGTGTTQFDLLAAGLSEAQFIKIVDDGDGTANSADAGFDLDAIDALEIVPVELILFEINIDFNRAKLKWETATETNNHGFEIERKNLDKQNSNSEWRIIGFVEGNGTSAKHNVYTYIDRNLTIGTYQYRLKQIDYDGGFEYSDIVEVDILLPIEFSLSQNYPNPFNPTTTLQYSIPENGIVKLSIYNLLGEQVTTIVNDYKEAGNYQIEFDASELSSGIYYYRLQANSLVKTRKMILMK